MKTEPELRTLFQMWLEAVRVEKPEPQTFAAGLASGYLQALALALDDDLSKQRAHVAISEIRRERQPE